MAKHFVSEPVTPCDAQPLRENEPALPAAFAWREQRLVVKALRETWRSTKNDRGDTYLKRHWYSFDTNDGRIATVYFDRAARRGESRWWLYAIEDETDEAASACPPLG